MRNTDRFPKRKHFLHENQRDSVQEEIKDSRKWQYNRAKVRKVIEFIDREHLKLKDTLYQSNSPEHIHYIKFLINFYQSFKIALMRDEELAFTTMVNSYLKLIAYMNKTQRDLGLASFYAMCLESPERMGMILSHAAHYTIGTVFLILYSSHIKYDNTSEKAYLNSNKDRVSAKSVASEILLRTMADIEKQGLIKIDPNTDADA